ncbi:MAG: hypothetical protein WA208_11605 [Thermoanaerobaculia bacterium]
MGDALLVIVVAGSVVSGFLLGFVVCAALTAGARADARAGIGEGSLFEAVGRLTNAPERIEPLDEWDRNEAGELELEPAAGRK